MQAHDIFLSYSKEDRSAAQRISARLESEGFSVWWDAEIHSGEAFDEVIEQQLRAAKAAVVLWSPRSVSSRWVRAEATLADRRRIFVPVIIEPCDLPIIFELSHSNDLSTWDGNCDAPAWRRLVDDIRRLAGAAEIPDENFSASPMEAPLSEGTSDAHPKPTLEPSETGHAGKKAMMSHDPASEAATETEQTAFYTRADSHRATEEVHCLEMGPPDAPVASYPIGMLGAKLGRAAPADIVFSDKRISRRHCEVEVKGGEMVVTDLQSTNGTFIDGQKIDSPTVLPAESELMLGDVILTHRVRSLADLS